MKSVLIIAPALDPHSGWGRYSLAVIKELESRPDLAISVLAEGRGLVPFTSVSALVKNCLYVRRVARSADIIHTLEAWPHALYGCAGVFGTRKKLIINAVGTYSIVPLRSFIKGMFLRRAYHRAQAVTAISAYTAHRLQQLIHLPFVKIVHLGMNHLPPVTAGDSERIKGEFSLAEVYPLILTVGEIKHRKGQLDTLKAVVLLKKEFPTIRYMCVGRMKDVEYVESMRTYAAEHHAQANLDMRSDLGDSDLAALYSIADVVALNSNNDQEHFEGFGMVLVEANSFGVPAVGSRDTGIEDAIKEGYSGFLAKQGDAEDIARAIRNVLEMPKETRRHNTREFAEGFSWKKTVDRYVEEYNRHTS